MIKYLLNCKNCSLEFESWFASSKEFDKLKKLKLLNCQSCESINVEKSLMTPNLLNTKKKENLTGTKKDAPTKANNMIKAELIRHCSLSGYIP